MPRHVPGDNMTVEDTINSTIKDGFLEFRKQYVALIIGTIVAVLMMLLIITIPPMIFGIFFMGMQVMKGKRVKITDVFKGFDYFFLSWGIIILAAIAICIGLVLLVIPGILLMILLQYTIAIALLENKGVIASLKRSYEIGKRNFTFSIVFFIFMAVINTVAGYTYVGLLAAIPFTSLCTIAAAGKLSEKEKSIKKETNA